MERGGEAQACRGMCFSQPGEAKVWAGQVPHASLPCEEPRAADSEVSRDVLTGGSLQAQPAPLGVRPHLQNWVPRDFSSSAVFGGGAGAPKLQQHPGVTCVGHPCWSVGQARKAVLSKAHQQGLEEHRSLLPAPARLMFGGMDELGLEGYLRWGGAPTAAVPQEAGWTGLVAPGTLPRNQEGGPSRV